MNTDANLQSPPNRCMLEKIIAMRTSIGDGLNDDELTHLLQTTLLTEAGFTFLSFSRGFVTLSVPLQDTAAWYPKTGWLSPEKEDLARTIGKNYGFSLCEPPDDKSGNQGPSAQSQSIRHHLELGNDWETIVIAHPHYLKIRLFGATSRSGFARSEQSPLPLPPNLLQELAALYC